MKICLIHNLYPPFARGGAEKVVKNLAQFLAERGDEVIVITTRPFGQKPGLNFAYQVYYLPSFYFNLSAWPYWARFFWHLADMFDLGGFLYVLKILQRWRPQVVITNNLAGLGLLAPLAVRLAKARHIHILHDIQLLHPSGLLVWQKEKIINTWPAKIYQFLGRRFLASPNLVVSPSQWLLDQHQQKKFFPASRCLVLTNPLKQEKIEPNQPAKQADRHLWRWLYVGQIEEHKGTAILLRAFSQLPAEVRKKSELVIVGEGGQLEAMKRLAKSYGLRAKHIYFLGFKNNQEVKQLMMVSDYLLVPSLCYENSPTVIYEALANSLPVIAFDLGGISELIKTAPNCLLLPPASWRDLAAAMERVFYARGQRSFFYYQRSNSTKQLKFLSVKDYVSRLGL